MNKKAKISVIIPVYNAEQYLDGCICSVLLQAYSNIELILVDDGSRDDSGKICDRYAIEDRRIKVVHKFNTGANDSRRIGIENAVGDYVYFMDSDDTIGAGELILLAEEMASFDIVMGGCAEVLVLNREQYLQKLLDHRIPLRLCGKLYRRNIVESSFFCTPCEIKMGEDMLSNVMLAKNVNAVKAIRDSHYQIDSSNSQSVSRGFVRDMHYEASFDGLLVGYLTESYSSEHINNLLAKQRYESLRFLLIEDKGLDINDPFISRLLLSKKHLQGRIPFLERCLLHLKPRSVSFLLLRYYVLMKRKFNIK